MVDVNILGEGFNSWWGGSILALYQHWAWVTVKGSTSVFLSFVIDLGTITFLKLSRVAWVHDAGFYSSLHHVLSCNSMSEVILLLQLLKQLLPSQSPGDDMKKKFLLSEAFVFWFTKRVCFDFGVWCSWLNAQNFSGPVIKPIHCVFFLINKIDAFVNKTGVHLK